MQSTSLNETTHMDRLTQTQDSIDELVKIMYSSLSYLTRKAGFKQVNLEIPITQIIPDSETTETFTANQHELVSDFLSKAKQLEYLFSALPSPISNLNSQNLEENLDQDMIDLEIEMQQVNKEYLEALTIAETLHAQLTESLKSALNIRTVLPP